MSIKNKFVAQKKRNIFSRELVEELFENEN